MAFLRTPLPTNTLGLYVPSQVYKNALQIAESIYKPILQFQTLQLPIVSRNWSLKLSQTPSRSLKTHTRGVKQRRTYESNSRASCTVLGCLDKSHIQDYLDGVQFWMFQPQRTSLYFVITEVVSTKNTDIFILLNGKLHLLMLHVKLLSHDSSQGYVNLLWQ